MLLLKEKLCLVSLAKGQIEQVLALQDLFAGKENKDETLLDGCPSLWCHSSGDGEFTTLHVPSLENLR